MLLFVVEKMLKEHGLYELDILYDIGMDVSLINSFISSMIMDYDFEEKGGLDFNSNYFPNSMISSYIFTIHRTEKYRDLSCPLFSEELMTVRERVDRNVIVTGISFMQIQAILLLMERSNLYPAYIKKVAKDLLFIFKEILANTRIKRIEIDAAICGGMVRNGVKKTTGIKIFFALENFDCYCLRIDFPHEGADYYTSIFMSRCEKLPIPFGRCSIVHFLKSMEISATFPSRLEIYIGLEITSLQK